MFRTLTPIRKISESVLDFIFPNICGYCDKGLKEEETLFCKNCWNSVPVNKLNTISAGRELKGKKKYYEYIAWGYEYNDIIREIIRDFKFHSYPVLHEKLAEAMLWAIKAREELLQADLIVPVPLHKSRLKERGFNQSELLAKYLSDASKIPMDFSLKRTRNTKPQSMIVDREKKLRNVQGAFSVEDKGNVSGANILLVDDIVTSGATVNECAKVLKKAGAKNVFVVTVVLS